MIKSSALTTKQFTQYTPFKKFLLYLQTEAQYTTFILPSFSVISFASGGFVPFDEMGSTCKAYNDTQLFYARIFAFFSILCIWGLCLLESKDCSILGCNVITFSLLSLSGLASMRNNQISCLPDRLFNNWRYDRFLLMLVT